MTVIKIKYSEDIAFPFFLFFIISLLMCISNFQERTFDSYAHMFFADHYRRAWFNFWEPKWYGGFYVTSYPPMAHQTLALLSLAIGNLELAFQILTLIILLLLLPLGMYHFSMIFLTEKEARTASALVVFLPSIITTAYVFGQFTTLFSLAFLLLFTYYFRSFTDGNKRSDKVKNFLSALCCLIISFCSHNFTTFFFAPIFLGTLLAKYILDKNKGNSKRLIITVTLASLISFIILLPYIEFTLSGQTQQPIPHASRMNLFMSWQGFLFFFLLMYGPLIIWIPLAIISVIKIRRKDLTLLLAVSIFLFLLGLGGTTPLPSLIFGEKLWNLLTYDRFSLWSTIMFTPLIALIPNLKGKHCNHLHKLLLLSLILFSVIILGISLRAYEFYLPRKVILDPVAEFLNNHDNWRWRYLTLGFGAPQMTKLSIITHAPTLDGFYVWARQDPSLRDSGIETIDGAKYWENGLKVLENILANSTKYKIKFVICNDPFYYEVLERYNFTLLFSQENTRDYRLGGVTIWVNQNDVPMLTEGEISYAHEEITLRNYIWGFAPLAVVVFLALNLNSLYYLLRPRLIRIKLIS